MLSLTRSPVDAGQRTFSDDHARHAPLELTALSQRGDGDDDERSRSSTTRLYRLSAVSDDLHVSMKRGAQAHCSLEGKGTGGQQCARRTAATAAGSSAAAAATACLLNRNG